MENEWKYMIIIITYFICGLFGAWILFKLLESYAEVWNPSIRLGGAIAGFFVIFVTLFWSYSKLLGRPASKLVKEASKVVTKPRGFDEYMSPEKGFSVYFPKDWKLVLEEVYSPIAFANTHAGTNLCIITIKEGKNALEALEKDPSEFSNFYGKIQESMFKGYKLLKKGTVALHGKQCPMYLAEKSDEVNTLKQTQIAYLDIKGEKLHWITFTCASDEYEDLKPLFEKILSTFQIL